MLVLNGITLFTLRSYLRDLSPNRWTVWAGPAFVLVVASVTLAFNAAHGLVGSAINPRSADSGVSALHLRPAALQTQWLLE